MTLNYTTFTQLPIDYKFVYLPSRYSRIPRFTDRRTEATVGLRGVQAVPAYEVTENNYKYIIYAYEGRLYWPLSLKMPSYPFPGVSNIILAGHDDKASNGRLYSKGEDNEKYAYNPAKSRVLCGDEQVIEVVKDWASKHMIAVASKAYIELKNPLIHAGALTDYADYFICDDDDLNNPNDFRLNQLAEFESYINHYRANLTYQIDHNLGNVPMAKVDLETINRRMKNNKIVKLAEKNRHKLNW